jgi:hypothetical protein
MRFLRALPFAALLLLLFAAPVFAQGDDSAGPNDRVVFGGNETIDPGETVRDVFVFGGNVTVNGSVDRDVTVFGGNADINAPVGRDVLVFGGNAKLTSNASVGRDLVAWGGNVDKAPGVHIGRNEFAGGGAGMLASPAALLGAYLVARVVASLALFVVAFLCLLVFPRHVEGAASLLQQRPGTTFGLGCLALPAALIAALVCAITVVLLPVTLIIAVVLLAAWLFGYAAVFLVLGRFLLGSLNRRAEAIPALLLGALIVTALSIVPAVGSLIGFIAGVLALGAALGSRFGTRAPELPIFGRAAPAYMAAYPYGQPPPYGYPYYGYTPPPGPPPMSAPAEEPDAPPPPPKPPRRPRKPRAPKPPASETDA